MTPTGDGLVDWIGSQYRDEDHQTTGRFADKRDQISLSCNQNTLDILSQAEFRRTNVGLLDFKQGYVLANDGGFEQNDEQSNMELILDPHQ